MTWHSVLARQLTPGADGGPRPGCGVWLAWASVARRPAL